MKIVKMVSAGEIDNQIGIFMYSESEIYDFLATPFMYIKAADNRPSAASLNKCNSPNLSMWFAPAYFEQC